MHMEFKATDVMSFDEGRGIVISCEQNTLVSLAFDASVPQDQVRELGRMFGTMKLLAVELDVPDLPY